LHEGIGKEKLFEREMKYWIRLLETADHNFLHPVVYHVTKVYLGAFKDRSIGQAVRRWFLTGGPGPGPVQVMWDLWWTKWHWNWFYPSTLVSPVNSHSTDCFIYHPVLVQ
jgi:hypothetical protein